MRIDSFVCKSLIKRKKTENRNKFFEWVRKNENPNLLIDVLYMNSKHFDLYRPSKPGKCLIIDIHGEIFSYGDKNNNFQLDYDLSQSGFTVLAPNFSEFNKMNFDDQINDVLKALDFLNENKKELGIDFSSITLLGHNSSSFLCFLLGLKKQNFFDKILLEDGLYNLPKYCESYKTSLNEICFTKIFGCEDFAKIQNQIEKIKTNKIGNYLCFFEDTENVFYKFFNDEKNTLIESKNLIKVISKNKFENISKLIIKEYE